MLVVTVSEIGDDVVFGELANDDNAGAEQLLLTGGIRLIPPVASGDGDIDEDDILPRG